MTVRSLPMLIAMALALTVPVNAHAASAPQTPAEEPSSAVEAPTDEPAPADEQPASEPAPPEPAPAEPTPQTPADEPGPAAPQPAPDRSAGAQAGTQGSPGTANRRVTVCHRTSSASNPFVLVSVDESALPTHRAHGDLIPPPPGGCPQPPPTCGTNALPCNQIPEVPAAWVLLILVGTIGAGYAAVTRWRHAR